MAERTDYPRFKESIIQETLASGMRIVILPKPGFVRKSATLVVPFGSLSHRVKLDCENKQIVFPAGTAHFLEHMLFESTSENIVRKFALLGASVNAYTTYNRTAIYFSTTNGLSETLAVLFDMIMAVQFTKESIEKEKSIIEKEIQLYEDDPEQCLYYDMLNLMYPFHPIRFDTTGTKTSLKEITTTILKQAFDAFYHPQAMVLVLSGDFDHDSTLASIQNHPLNQNRKPFLRPEVLLEEDIERKDHDLTVNFDLMSDLVLAGVKMVPLKTADEAEITLEEIKLNLLLDNLYGKASPAFKKLQAAKIVNNAFDIGVACDRSFAYATLFTETKNSPKTISVFKEMIHGTKNAAIFAEYFEIQKRKLLGNFIQVFDSVSRANAMFAEYCLRGVDVFRLFGDIEHLTVADLEGLKTYFAEGAITTVNYLRHEKSGKSSRGRCV